MNLTDEEILELTELCSALIDDRLTDAQRQRLEGWLARSEAARRFYVRAMGQSASLHLYASESHAEPARAPARPGRKWAWFGGIAALAAAAALVAAFVVLREQAGSVAGPVRAPVMVARVSAVKDAVWPRAAVPVGTQLSRGHTVELVSGLAEVTFDSGAKLVLEGPAALTVNSAWESTLRSGTLSATVPPQAIGFRVSNPSVEVVDLGTEFTMVAGADGNTEVFVLKGEIEASPRSGANEVDFLLLREREARRFSRSGVSDVTDSESKFERYAQPWPLERTASLYRFAHWSFDGPDRTAGRLHAGGASQDFPARGAWGDLGRARGRQGEALVLDGNAYLSSSFEGIAGDAPHTVAFWVRVPESAPLSEAYAIVGWRSNLAKLNYRPVHISWNRNPQEGPLGAIRTDFAGGCAIGTTSLRDGQWHHVAIVFAPGAGDVPVQVKQYVDGVLESSTTIPGRTRGPAGVREPGFDDRLWVGSRLGANGPRQERFRGEIDELFVFEGVLAPQEIVALQQENRVDPAATVATR